MTGLRAIPVVVALALAAAVRVASGQETAPPVGGPAQVQGAVPDAPVQMRAADAERLRSSLAASPVLPAPAAPPPPSGGVSHTIDLEPPPVVNRSSEFQFRDATDRPPRAVVPMAVRQAAVEAYRRSLPGAKVGGR